MNKRQRKKKMKKYLPIIGDEANLLTMTANERDKAIQDFEKFKEKFAYRKKYKDLKEGKPLQYYYPIGQTFADTLINLSTISRGPSNTIKVHQNLYTKE